MLTSYCCCCCCSLHSLRWFFVVVLRALMLEYVWHLQNVLSAIKWNGIRFCHIHFGLWSNRATFYTVLLIWMPFFFSVMWNVYVIPFVAECFPFWMCWYVYLYAISKHVLSLSRSLERRFLFACIYFFFSWFRRISIMLENNLNTS